MQTKFMINGSTVNVVSLNAETALDALPPKVYTVVFDKAAGFYYLSILKDELVLPTKIYGSANIRVNKCIHTYKTRTSSTGILLSGDKGTGKTLLMSLLANRVMDELKLPVILIREPFAGEGFSAFLDKIGECCLVFDEFGKLYKRRADSGEVSQDSLLSMLDGVDKVKRLIILTENSEYDISDYMLNRPSRIFYHFRYRKLDEDSIIGYCQDHDVPTLFIDELIDLSRRTKVFSFDMLQAVVEEFKRFGESLATITTELNIDVRTDAKTQMKLVKVIEKATGNERKILSQLLVARPTDRYSYTYIRLQPTNQVKTKGTVSSNKASTPEFVEHDDDESANTCTIDATHLVYEVMGKYVYENDMYQVLAQEVPQANTEYSNLF